jgi:hypothetical protein
LMSWLRRNTGRRPNDVLIGTLQKTSVSVSDIGQAISPNKITKPQHQNTHARKLNGVGEVALERLHERGEHGRQRERAEALAESNHCRGGDAGGFPPRRPVQRVVRVV